MFFGILVIIDDILSRFNKFLFKMKEVDLCIDICFFFVYLNDKIVILIYNMLVEGFEIREIKLYCSLNVID